MVVLLCLSDLTFNPLTRLTSHTLYLYQIFNEDAQRFFKF